MHDIRNRRLSDHPKQNALWRGPLSHRRRQKMLEKMKIPELQEVAAVSVLGARVKR